MVKPRPTFAAVPAGTHTVRVYCAQTGYLSTEDPTQPHQVDNRDNPVFGNPRRVHALEVDAFSVAGYAAFSFMPFARVSGHGSGRPYG